MYVCMCACIALLLEREREREPLRVSVSPTVTHIVCVIVRKSVFLRVFIERINTNNNVFVCEFDFLS